MKGRDYIREVFRDLSKSGGGAPRERSELFMMAALDVLRELDSPQKEETLVRLVMMQAEEERQKRPPKREVAA